VTPRHRRGDCVILVGSGPRAHVEKVAACRCGWRDDRPRNDIGRDIAWREHREAAS